MGCNGTTLLLQGDCLELLGDLQPHSVDLVLADPPYGTTQNKWDSAIPLGQLWGHIRRVLKPTGTVVLTAQGPFTAKLTLSNEEWFKYRLVWVKSKATNFLNAKKQPLRKHEDILVFAPGRGQYFPQMQPGKAYDKGIRKDQQTGSYGEFAPVRVSSEGMRYPTDVLYFKTAESEGPVVHSTQKPQALMEYLVRTYSKRGDLVLDYAMGSGSTACAALRLGRHFVGIESDAAIFSLAKTRIAGASL